LTLTQILLFAALALLAGRFYKVVNRNWLLFVASVLAVFWLQPASAIRNLFFFLPCLSLSLAALVWSLTLPRDVGFKREDWRAVALLVGLALFLSATRYFESLCCLTASRPPQIELVAFLLVLISALVIIIFRLGRGRTWLLNLAVLFILLLFIVLKSEPVALRVSAGLRSLGGQDPQLASSLDIGWLGFSYIAFRLIHTLRDRLAGRLPQVSLRDFVTYIVFFPALTAGPIDRIQRFQGDLQRNFTLQPDQIFSAGRRLVTGLFMKFILADGLAFFALNSINAVQTQSSIWMWLLLLAFSFRLFFDFAGYTQIAIGLGMLFGIFLPENFDRPYLKPNITAFWNSWHITLAQWFRSYYFNPLTRFLRIRNLPVWLIILFAQLSTMALIGLWHGLTWNFLAWGLWHGGGLFVHNQWVQFTKTRRIVRNPKLSLSFGIFATFAFVTLGWVWFALPQPADALRVLRILFGIAA